MIEMFQQLMLSAGLYMLCAIGLGTVFDRLAPGRWRSVAVGATCAAGVAGLSVMPPIAGGLAADATGPLLLVGSLLGGPLGTAVLLPAPLALRILEGGPAVLTGACNILLACAVGLAVALVCQRINVPVRRRAVLVLGAASPIALLGYALPEAAPLTEALSGVLATMLVWTPLGTVVFGFAVVSELVRAEVVRTKVRRRLFETLTGTVPPDVFQGQLAHQWRMHERYGQDYAYMLVSIDDAIDTRAAVGSDEWERLRAIIATHIKRATRDCDVCTAIDHDRFGVILPHATLPSALPVARRVQAAVQEAAGFATAAGRVTVSIGCAEVEGTTRPNDVEAAAEGELFLANTRQRASAIGPWLDTAASDGLVRSFPGAAKADEASAPPRRSGALVRAVAAA